MRMIRAEVVPEIVLRVVNHIAARNEGDSILVMNGEFILALISAVFGGATTWWVCRHLPDWASPKPDLEQVELLIESASKGKTDSLNAD